MGLLKSTKKVAGRIVDVRVDKWISLEYLSETTDKFKTLLFDIAIPKKPVYSESFEEAMQRLSLSEEDLNARKREFSRLLYFFIVLTIVIVGYGLLMAFRGSMIPSLIAFCLAFYALTQAFRFHFWLFQIRHRKLGCTLKEWMNSKVMDEMHPSLKKDVMLKEEK